LAEVVRLDERQKGRGTERASPERSGGEPPSWGLTRGRRAPNWCEEKSDYLAWGQRAWVNVAGLIADSLLGSPGRWGSPRLPRRAAVVRGDDL